MSRKGVSGRFVGEPDFRMEECVYDLVQGSIRGSKLSSRTLLEVVSNHFGALNHVVASILTCGEYLGFSLTDASSKIPTCR